MSTSKQCTAYTVGQTKKLGRELAKKILKKGPSKTAMVLALQGELGSGKTTFVQGFAKGLDIKEKILSPTFVIMRKFQLASFFHDREKMKPVRFSCFYHMDCYRIQDPKEILALGFKEIITEPKNIIAIEWAERIKDILSKNCLTTRFEFIDKTRRKITLKNFQFPCQKRFWLFPQLGA